MDDTPSRIGRTVGNRVHKHHPGLAELLETECTNKTGGAAWHRHIHLIGGIAQQAAKYPPQLVRAVLKCLKRELEERGELNAADAHSAGPVPEMPTIDPEWEERCVDDVNGGVLPKEEVAKATSVEMQYLHKQEVYLPVPIEQCFEEKGNPRSRPDGLIQIRVIQVPRTTEAG